MWVGCPPPPAEPDCCDVPSSAAACSFFSDAEPPFSPPPFCAVSEPHAATNISDTATNKSAKGPATLRTIGLLPVFSVRRYHDPRMLCYRVSALMPTATTLVSKHTILFYYPLDRPRATKSPPCGGSLRW